MVSSSVSQHLAYLDLLPDSLYLPVVTHGHGDLQQRCTGVLSWLDCLLQGQLPEEGQLHWPAQPARHLLIEKLQQSNIAPYCRDQVQRSEQLLLDILQWLDGDIRDFSTPAVEPPAGANQSSAQTADSTASPPSSVSKNNLPEDSAAALSWQQQAATLDAMQVLGSDFVLKRQLGWDLSSGLLARTEWKAVLAVHKSIKHAQYLKNIIALIGRGAQEPASDEPFIDQSLIRPAVRKQQHDRRTVQAPMEAAGISRSDDIGRMLSSELAALGHAKLKMLWHAKRAEALLLCYQYEGVLSEHMPVYQNHARQIDDSGKNIVHARGPMIICLDTSRSMQGQPESVAKAIVLETMRVAMREQRACMLFAFSGPEEIHAYELDHSENGWANILDIISMSFHGGTELSTVMQHAVDLIDHKHWQQADLLLVSDSRFAVDDALIEQLQLVRQERGLRLHGINVSNWNSDAMEKICQPVYRINRIPARH